LRLFVLSCDHKQNKRHHKLRDRSTLYTRICPQPQRSYLKVALNLNNLPAQAKEVVPLSPAVDYLSGFSIYSFGYGRFTTAADYLSGAGYRAPELEETLC